MDKPNLSPREVALTAYRVFCEASLLTQFPPLEEIPWDKQVGWQRLARLAEDTLLAHEGKSWVDAAKALATLYSGSEQALASGGWEQARIQIAWQAVARHLAYLLDGGDIQDLEALELSWREWVKSRHPAIPSTSTEGA